MANTIEISDEQKILSVDKSQLRRTVEHVLRDMKVSKWSVSLAILEDAGIERLKEAYFGRREVTDVISFDFREGKEGKLECEIVVNTECAVRVAGERSGDPHAELNLYVVHGLLHQLGYNDQELRDSQIMHEKEDELLDELGFGKVFGGTG